MEKDTIFKFREDPSPLGDWLGRNTPPKIQKNGIEISPVQDGYQIVVKLDNTIKQYVFVEIIAKVADKVIHTTERKRCAEKCDAKITPKSESIQIEARL